MIRKKDGFIKDSGGSGETIVLLHGFLASQRYWNQLRPELIAAGYRVISIDLLGFGSAPKPKRALYSYEDHIAHIHRALSSLTLPAHVTLVGHSMGGLLSARYAREYPKHISSLALINPPIYRDRAQVRQTLRATSRIYRFFLDSRFRHILWVFVRTFGPFGPHTKQSREGSLTNVIEATELFTDLSAVRCHVLLLAGTKDRKEYLENLAHASVGDNVTIIHEPVAHHAPRHQPKMVAARLFTFLRKN